MLRPLLHYFLIGGLLFVGKSLVDRNRADGPEIWVEVSSDATAREVEAKVREAILLNEARRYGWDRQDPVVFTHLVRNMRFIEPESTESDLELYKRAISMNMHLHDPVVRARLLYRAREALARVPSERMPDRAALEAHRAAHPDRFERDPRVRFQHVFLSGTKRGDSLPTDAQKMREQLSTLGQTPPDGLGDPLPGLRAEQVATPRKVAAEYGDSLASVLEEDIVGSWRGPLQTIYGLHFVKVLEHEPPSVPPLDAIIAEVRADYLRELRDELSDERMRELRDAYAVHVERSP